MDIFEWDEETPVTANNLNEMQNTINANITSEITDATKWTLLGTTTGNQQIDLPSSWKELYVVSSVAGSSSLIVSWHIIKETVVAGKVQYRTGFYLTSTNNMGASIYFRNSGATGELIESYFNSSSVINTQSTIWYYK